jgi:transcriptional regulator with XRE-family HTH domain
VDSGLFLCFFNEMFPSGRILKAARVGMGLNPDEVAEEAGISRASLSRLEAGSLSVSVKVADSVRKVLENYGVRFLTGDGAVGPSIRFPVDYQG